MYHFRYKGKVAPNTGNDADPWIAQVVKDILEGRSNVAITAKRAGCSTSTIYGLISGRTKRPMRLPLDGILRANGMRMAMLPMQVPLQVSQHEVIPVKRYHYQWSPKDIIQNKKGAKIGHRHHGVDVAKRKKV